MTSSWPPKPVIGAPDGTVLFDGVCVLCSWWVQFIIARDPAARFRFIAVQTPYGRALAAKLGIDAEFPETNAVILGGRAYFKSDAAIQILSRLPSWSWAELLSLCPRSIRHWLYDRIARNRYQLFGRTDACMIPTSEVRRHFLSEPPAS